MSRCTVMPHVSSCSGRRVNTPARDLRPTPRRAQRRRVPLAGRAARTRTTARSSSSGVRGAHDLHLDHLQHPNTFVWILGGETRLPFKLGDAECGLRGVSDVVMRGPPVEGRAETFLEHLEPVSKGLQWGIAKGSSR